MPLAPIAVAVLMVFLPNDVFVVAVSNNNNFFRWEVGLSLWEPWIPDSMIKF